MTRKEDIWKRAHPRGARGMAAHHEYQGHWGRTCRARARYQREYYERQYNPYRDDPGETVESVLDFLRQWPGHRFPRYLMALDVIQKEIFGRYGLSAGNYTAYAAQVENLFLPGSLGALDEYGIPIQVAMKLRDLLQRAQSLDELLETVAYLPERAEARLSSFERTILRDAQESLR